MEEKQYLCIDLKSFYASVECVERGLDPMTTPLVVADPERSDKTICLAVSPRMKEMGVKNRCRVFEIPKNIRYIMAVPRMQKYIDYAAEIYGIYLRYFSPQDIHVYSIDEAFIDVTPYLHTYRKSARELALELMERIWQEVGVRATAGIGTNLYLTKIALDITAKHAADYIGELTEESYRETLWDHRPLTDFWRIGSRTARHLEKLGLTTMGEIAHYNEEVLYRHFGVDAELLIDHAWGREPVTMGDIKKYRPKTRSLTSGQVLMRDYRFEEAAIVLREMVEQLCLDMAAKKWVSDSMTIYVGYSNSLHLDPVRGTAALDVPSHREDLWAAAVQEVYERIVDRDKGIRRFYVYANRLLPDTGEEQLSLFAGDGQLKAAAASSWEESPEAAREARAEATAEIVQETMLDIKGKFGKNAIFKSADLQQGATALERNRQIGGHKSGE